MRIGIDARFLTHPQRGGFKSYTQTVIASLIQTETEHEFVLYTDREYTPPSKMPDNFSIRPVPARNAFSREQLALPNAMMKDGVEIAHFLCNTAPIFRHPTMVVTIHDAIALHNTKQRTGRLDAKHRLLHTYWRTVIPQAARKSKRVITDSSFAQRDLSATLGIQETKFHIVHIPVNQEFAVVADDPAPDGIRPGDQFILAFAAADGRKNHPNAIEAFRRIAPEFPNLRMVLVCSHQSVSEPLKELGVERLVTLDPVSMEELRWLYRNAVGLVFPSLDEGFGLPPLEAMSCGTPVVASKGGSLPEVLGDKMIPINPLDPKSIAEGLELLLRNETLRLQLSAAGPERAKRFSQQRMGSELTAIYADAILRGS